MQHSHLFREVLSTDSAASSPAGDEGETVGGEEGARAKKNRLREEQRQRRKAVSDSDLILSFC